MTTPHPIGKDELRDEIDNLLLSFKQAPISTTQALNVVTYRNKILKAINAYTIEAEKRAELRGRIDERRELRELFDALGLRIGASAGSATGVTVRNSFDESWDFQLDRDALGALLGRFNSRDEPHTPPQANDKELEAQIIKVVRPYVSNDFQEDRAVDEIVDLIHKDRAAAQQALLEELDRESEVIGVGYPVIRAEHVRKRSSMSAYTDGLTDIDPDARYNCPECKNHYSGRWIKRHLVAKHGYLYWDGYNVYKPAEAVTDGKVNTVTDLESTDSDEAKGPSNPPNNHKE